MKVRCVYCKAYSEAGKKYCFNCKSALPYVAPKPVVETQDAEEEETELDRLNKIEQEELENIEHTKKVLRSIYIGAAIIFIVFFIIVMFVHISFTGQFGY